jgi:ribosomal protein S18 acetylase RimI-like enzyme
VSREVSLARPDEFEAVDALVLAAYEHDYGPRDRSGDPFHRAEHRAASFDIWVTREAGAAGALLGTVTTPRPGGAALMEDIGEGELDFRLLAVSPDARHRGIGELLTRHVLQLARERGLDGVFLKSAPDMVGAHRLYEKVGFRRDPGRDGLVVDGVRVKDLYAFVTSLSPKTPSDTPSESRQ